MSAPVRIERPASAAAAQALRAAAADVVFVAGGTALQLGWTDGAPAGLTLVDVARLSAAQGITLTPAGRPGLRIGAAVTLEALRLDERVVRLAPMLAQVCAEIGSLPVRTWGTLGGNAGWRYGDALAVLLVLQARVELADGSVRPLEDWLAAEPLPLAVAFHLDGPAAPASPCWYEKIGQREAFAPSMLTLAQADGRVAAVAAGLPARRLRRTEACLAGPSVDASVWQAALQADLDDDGVAGVRVPVGPADVRWRASAARRLLLGHSRSSLDDPAPPAAPST